MLVACEKRPPASGAAELPGLAPVTTGVRDEPALVVDKNGILVRELVGTYQEDGTSTVSTVTYKGLSN